MWKGGQRHASVALLIGKETPCSLCRKRGGPQGPVWTDVEIPADDIRILINHHEV
jgi:hypothetical protein